MRACRARSKGSVRAFAENAQRVLRAKSRVNGLTVVSVRRVRQLFTEDDSVLECVE